MKLYSHYRLQRDHVCTPAYLDQAIEVLELVLELSIKVLVSGDHRSDEYFESTVPLVGISVLIT